MIIYSTLSRFSPLRLFSLLPNGERRSFGEKSPSKQIFNSIRLGFTFAGFVQRSSMLTVFLNSVSLRALIKISAESGNKHDDR